jgi:hypothetical protein
MFFVFIVRPLRKGIQAKKIKMANFDKIETHLGNLEQNIKDLEDFLNPFLNKSLEDILEENNWTESPLQAAKLLVTLVYAIDSLYFGN